MALKNYIVKSFLIKIYFFNKRTKQIITKQFIKNHPSYVDRLQITLNSNRLVIILQKLTELISITHIQFRKSKHPLINIHRMFITNSCWFQKVICILLCLCLCYILLYVFIKPHCLVKIYCFQIVKINVVKYLL